MISSYVPSLFRKSLAAALILLIAPFASRGNVPATTNNMTAVYANGGVVTTGGNGTTTLTITSTAPITVLNWGNFWDGTTNGGVSGTADSITYTLPSATSSLLNAISGAGTTNPTTINGTISSNGKVSFLNANGIVIGGGAAINTAAFYASTLPEAYSYFETNGILQAFTATPPSIATSGTISVQGSAPMITTVGSTGDIRLAANGISVDTGATGSIAGNLYLVNVGTGTLGGISLAPTAGATITGGAGAGNVSILSKGAAVTVSAGGPTSIAGNLSITTAGNSVALTGGTGDTTTVTGTTTISTVGNSANGNVTQGSALFTSSAATITTGTGSSTADGSVILGNISLGTTPISVTGGGAGGVSLTDGTDATLTLGNMTLSGNLIVSATGNVTTQNFGSTSATPAAVVQNGTGLTLNLTADSGGANNETLTFNGTGAENFTGLTMPGTGESATITTTGNITLSTGSAVSVSTLSLTTTGGTITQSTGGVGGAIASNTLLTVSAPTVTLNNADNAISNVVLIGGGTGGISLADAVATLTIANKTNAAGNVTVTNSGNGGSGNIALGAANADTLTFGGNLTLNLTNAAAPGTEELTTAAGTVSVTGNTTIASSGAETTLANNAISLGNSAAAPVQAYTFTGPVSVAISGANGGPVSIFANNGLVLGTITTGSAAADTLTVTSALTGTANSGISDPSAVISVGSIATPANATFAAGTSGSPSNIQIGGTSNPAVLTGNIEVDTANNLSLTNSVATTIVAGTNPIGGQTTLTQTGNGAAGAVTINDSIAKLSIAQTGTGLTGAVAVTIPTGNVALSNFSLNGSGPVSVTTGTGLVGDTGGSITLGANVDDGTTATTTFTARGSAASITDTANSPVWIYGNVTFNSDGPINIGNNTANSLGGIQLNLTTTSVATNNNNITYSEGSGANIQQISVPGGLGGTYGGTVAISSLASIVLETNTSSLILPSTATLTLTADSAGGAVLLNSTIAAVNQLAAAVSVNATGNSTVKSNQTLNLSGVTVSGGNFTADTSATPAVAITEASGTTVNVSGNAKFVTSGGNITVNQTGNNYGTITAASTGAAGTAGAVGTSGTSAGNITIKAYNNAVVAAIDASGGNGGAGTTTNGNGGNAGTVSVTSETGAVTESGASGITAAPGLAGTGTGAAGTAGAIGSFTFAAPGASSGNIDIEAAGNNFSAAPVSITTTGNATVDDANPVTSLAGGTDVTKNLTVTNTSAAGVIKDTGAGNITVGGVGAFFVSPTGGGDISFTGGNNSIPTVELKAGTGTTTFIDNVSLAIAPGTAVNGVATISSGGTISISTTGPVSFLRGLTLNAVGNITVNNTSALFNSQVTATTSGPSSLIDFSAMSLMTNFNSIAPIGNGSTTQTASYKPPGP